MKKALTFKIGAISAILIAVFIAIPLVEAQGETSYSFIFMGRTKAARAIPGTHVKAGDWLCLIGVGTFDTSDPWPVSGGGAFAHVNNDGTLHGRGIWTVKQFVSFTPYGGSHLGKQGGLLKVIIEATSTWSVHWAETGSEKFIFMLQISTRCPGGTPTEGFTVWGGPGYVVPVFGVVVWGCTLFHLNE